MKKCHQFTKYLSHHHIHAIPKHRSYSNGNTDSRWFEMFLPTKTCENILDHLHDSMELPWWAVIATCGVGLKIGLLPFTIHNQKNQIRTSNASEERQHIIAQLEKLSEQPNAKESEFRRLENELNVSTAKMVSISFRGLVMAAQTPFHLGMIYSIRKRIPESEFSFGDIDWLHALPFLDVSMVLPVSVGFISLIVNTCNQIASRRDRSSKYVRPFAISSVLVSLVGSVVVFIVLSFFDAPMQLYIFSASGFHVLFSIVMMAFPRLRRLARYPQRHFIEIDREYLTKAREAFKESLMKNYVPQSENVKQSMPPKLSGSMASSKPNIDQLIGLKKGRKDKF